MSHFRTKFSFFAALALAVTSVLLVSPAHARVIGDVSTTFKIVGPNNKIIIEVFEDPKVSGVPCFLSRAKTGGVKGALGIAEDTSDASIACRQVGTVSFKSANQAARRNLHRKHEYPIQKDSCSPYV